VIKKLIILIVTFILGAGSTLFFGTEIPGLESDEIMKVSRVIDGDTIVLANGERVRLIGIDTPERGEFGYEEATKYLENLIDGKEVRLKKDVEDRDHYGRLLRYIYTKDGRFVNKLLVEDCVARPYPYKPNTKYWELFEEVKCDNIKRLFEK